jgi:hypothetical protein
MKNNKTLVIVCIGIFILASIYYFVFITPQKNIILDKKTNSWYNSAKNIRFNNNILEAELITSDGNFKYNRIEIHPLLLNKPLINENGVLKYKLSKEDDDKIMKQLFPIYNGPTIPHINISKCIMLSVDIPKYNNEREQTLKILNNYKLPPIEVHYGYTSETCTNSKFYKYLIDKNQRNELTLGMLEIFEKFVNENIDNEWLLYFEDDVRPINIDINQDLTKLYNTPYDAELIRPFNGKNERCDIKNISYNISYAGGLTHAFYISVSGCKKVLNYAKKYGWKYNCDIDLCKLAKHCGRYPVRFDTWCLIACNCNNDITEKLEENEKINMYQISHCIFNQTSNPCV